MVDVVASKLRQDEEETVNLTDLSHKQACEYIREELNDILKEPLLRDLPQDPTCEEIKSRVALEQGKAIIVNLKRQGETEEILPLVVEQTATVTQLKLTVQRYLSLKLKRENGPTYLSWRYFWKTYWLTHDGEKLTDDSKHINEYGIINQTHIAFIKRLRR